MGSSLVLECTEALLSSCGSESHPASVRVRAMVTGTGGEKKQHDAMTPPSEIVQITSKVNVCSRRHLTLQDELLAHARSLWQKPKGNRAGTRYAP